MQVEVNVRREALVEVFCWGAGLLEVAWWWSFARNASANGEFSCTRVERMRFSWGVLLGLVSVSLLL